MGTLDPQSQFFAPQVYSRDTIGSDKHSPFVRLNVVADKYQSHLNSQDTLAMPSSSAITSPLAKKYFYQQQENCQTNANMTTLEQAEMFTHELHNLDDYYKKLILQERESFQIILASKMNVVERDIERKLEK